MSTLRDMYVSMRFRDQASAALRNIDRLVDQIEHGFHSLGSSVNTSTSGFQSLVREVGRLETELSSTRTEMQGLRNRIDESEQEMANLRNEVNRLNSAASESNSIFSSMAGKVTTVVGALGGIAVGASVVSTAMEMDKAFSRLEARTGLTGAELKALEGVTKDVFRAGFSENITQAADDVSTLRGQFKNFSEQELAGTAKGVYTVTESFDQDFNEVSRTVAVLTKNFKDLDATTALDGITYGFQNGLNYSDELLDTLREYAPQFNDMGMGFDNMISVLQAGTDAGAWNLDKVGDAIKESHLRMGALDKATVDAYKSMGFNADEYVGKISQGGEVGNQAFQEIVGSLMKVEDATERNQLATDLFGTQFEDLQEKVIFSLAEASTATAEFGGATQRAGEALQNNFGTRATKVWRDLQLGMVEAFQSEEMQNFLGSVMSDIESAVPSIKNAFSSMAEVITNNVEPAYAGFKTGVGWIIDNKDLVVAALTGVAGGFALLKGITIVKTALDLYKTSTFASTFATHGFNAALRANPIGLVVTAIGLLIGAGVYLYQNWDTVKVRAGELWDKTKEVFGGIYDWGVQKIQPVTSFFQGLYDKFISFKDAITNFQPPEWVSKIGGAIGKAAGAVGNFISGSHATGLERVPYDGYIAELHRDETVLTAQQSSALRSAGMLSQNSDGTPELNMGGGGTTQQAPNAGGGGHQFIFQITGDNPMDIAQKVREILSDLLGEELQIM